MKQQFTGPHVTLLVHIIMTWRPQVFVLTCYCCMISREAHVVSVNLVLGLTPTVQQNYNVLHSSIQNIILRSFFLSPNFQAKLPDSTNQRILLFKIESLVNFIISIFTPLLGQFSFDSDRFQSILKSICT